MISTGRLPSAYKCFTDYFRISLLVTAGSDFLCLVAGFNLTGLLINYCFFFLLRYIIY
jgi:hypothetical protein